MITATVDGYVGTYQFELTSSNTQTFFGNAINTLLNIGKTPTTQLTTADVTKYNDALNVLKDLAKGFIPGTTNLLDRAITAQMANSINALISVTQSVNDSANATQIASINNSIGLNDLTELTLWKDIYVSGAQPILTNAALHSDNTSTTTLQSYLQTNYIASGNELIFSQLTKLKQAISGTQEALILMGNIQSLKNRASILVPNYSIASKWGAGLLPTKKLTLKNGVQILTQYGVGSIASVYQGSTKSTIGSRLLIEVDPAFAASIEQEGDALALQLSAIIDKLNLINPAGSSDKNSLQSQLKTVYDDMTQPGAATTIVQNNIQWWILDNYDDKYPLPEAVPGTTQTVLFSKELFNTAKAGNFQRNITNAITTAENLNDSQKADLQTTIFNFQEFYQSASAILKMINKFMQQVANQINR